MIDFNLIMLVGIIDSLAVDWITGFIAILENIFSAKSFLSNIKQKHLNTDQRS